MDCSPPGSSVRGVLQTWILPWVAIPFSRESSQPKDRTRVSCIAGRFFTVWATREALHIGGTKLVFELTWTMALINMRGDWCFLIIVVYKNNVKNYMMTWWFCYFAEYSSVWLITWPFLCRFMIDLIIYLVVPDIHGHFDGGLASALGIEFFSSLVLLGSTSQSHVG